MTGTVPILSMSGVGKLAMSLSGFALLDYLNLYEIQIERMYHWRKHGVKIGLRIRINFAEHILKSQWI